MAVTSIHHINFLVKDLAKGISRYQQLLGLGDFIVDDLPGRGVKTARIALGEQWLVLVQPVDMEAVPGKHLAEHGEGFFLISYAVEDLQQSAAVVAAAGSQGFETSSRFGGVAAAQKDRRLDHERIDVVRIRGERQ